MKDFVVQVEHGKEGRDGKLSLGPIFRSSLSKDEFPPADPAMGTSWEVFRISVDKYPENKMLGWREFLNGKAGCYLWKTYKEVFDEVFNIGSALQAMGAKPGSRVGIYGANCPQWVVSMQVCNGYSLICVPLYDTLGPAAVDFIIRHAEIDFVFVQDKKVKELLRPDCISARQLKLIVCFTELTMEQKGEASLAGIQAYSWNEFIQMGKENPAETFAPQPHDICTIMYTSGTSGEPKGVVLTHENLAYYVRGLDLFMDLFEDKNINAIREDLMELKPTLLTAVPRVFDRVHEGILKSLEELNPRRRKIFNLLYRYKRGWMRSGYSHKWASPLADFLAFRKVKARLGGRIRLMVSGGAPLSAEVEEFLRVTGCAFFIQGYGLTETCGMTTCCYPDDMALVGTVGVPSVYTEICLEEVPEMGYDPLTVPSRGEICVRGKSVFSGYYKNPDLTREVIRDGWFHTGDIGEMSPDGILRIIDRKKNIFKLSQGEYVAAEYLEKIYGFTPIVEDIWVYGDSFRSMLVAVVLPNEDHTKKWAELNGHFGSSSELCLLNELMDHVLLELQSSAKNNKLRGFEYIKGVILEHQPFDVERDLVTPTMKKKRAQLLKHYQVEIDELYAKLNGKK
ncbi:long chain acyl-CoA synthetase 1-like isoform X2 [Aristolochia californica]|uniref:long chain acyl-CoA synthetase 1-like isoform X2 n=1 Tax=Aristolochia californica TaxID=171875 RepID=UPI0035E266B3